MKEILKVLSKPLDLNKEVDWRVQSLKKSGQNVYAIILGYKDARVDMNRLDEATNGMWSNQYERDSRGVLKCSISIKYGDDVFTKWSNGVQSATEKEKGEYSDAFKRAGFMWGIGRELYDLPFIYLKLENGEYTESGGKIKSYEKFSSWKWVFNKDGNLEAFKEGKKRFTSKESRPIMDDDKSTTSSPRLNNEVEVRVDKMRSALESATKENINNIATQIEAVVNSQKDLFSSYSDEIKALIKAKKNKLK